MKNGAVTNKKQVAGAAWLSRGRSATPPPSVQSVVCSSTFFLSQSVQVVHFAT